LGERRKEVALLTFMINHMLEVSSIGKKERGEGVPLPNTTLAPKAFSRSAIKQNNSGGRAKLILNPLNPFRRETFSS
jgi:hypothetical protein